MLSSSHQTKRASNVLENWEATLDSLVLWGILRRVLFIAPTFSGAHWTKHNHSNKCKYSRTVCIGRSESLAFTRGGFLCVGLYNLHCLCSQRGGALIPLTYMHLKGVMREISVGGKVLFYLLVMSIISIIWVLYAYYKYYKYFSSHFSISKVQGQFYGSIIDNSKGNYILFVSNPSFYLF